MKWILVLTMPSGSLWVLGEREGSLALFPAKKEGMQTFKGVFGFENESDAAAWIKKTASMSDKGAKMMKDVRPYKADMIQ